MTHEELINHAKKIDAVKNMIIKEQVRLSQLYSVKESKVWLFYSKSENEEWYKKFFHEVEIKKATIERLKLTYSKICKTIENEQNN